MGRIRGASALAVVGCLACAPSAGAAASGAPYEPHTVIVKYADGMTAAQRALGGVFETIGHVSGTGADVVRVAGDPADVATRLSRLDAVVYAEPNYIVSTTAAQIPNDMYFFVQTACKHRAGRRAARRGHRRPGGLGPHSRR